MEMQEEILLTGFRNTAAELLLKNAEGYRTLILPNDKIRDSEELRKVLADGKIRYVISVGQRPNIKDKVHIETTAREKKCFLETDFDCEKLMGLFIENGIPAKLSHNAGTSYCNCLYWNGLKYLSETGMDTKMVFVHIPFARNISDYDGFQKRFFKAISGMWKKSI